MKTELRKHLPPLIVIFLLTSVFWFFRQVSLYNYFYLFLGLVVGAFFLDIDHLIYWLYLNPNTDESRLGQLAIKKYDFRSIIKLLESTHKKHVSLVFHHFFFQVVLAAISVFILTSSGNSFAMAFILALNIHLIVDEIDDYHTNKPHLQNWLFARESKQLPQAYLFHYIAIFSILSFIFFLMLSFYRS
ncbi:hypothetical protein KBC75_03855 [Candidatus Shapirobacteria bacterium]|nr:hypothetical protein [Candidatus Shapirobacteria bacterium]